MLIRFGPVRGKDHRGDEVEIGRVRMKRVRGKVGRPVPEPAPGATADLDAVVLQQIFFSAGDDPWDRQERLRRRRLLRRLLRRPAARIASRRVKRKRLLDRLDQQVLGDEVRAVQTQRRGEVRHIIRLTQPATPAAAPRSPAARGGGW
ncbi:hypothetical protein, partial [Xanthobacter sp. NFM-89]